MEPELTFENIVNCRREHDRKVKNGELLGYIDEMKSSTDFTMNEEDGIMTIVNLPVYNSIYDVIDFFSEKGFYIYLASDKRIDDFYTNDINSFEEMIRLYNHHTFKLVIGYKPLFVDNTNKGLLIPTFDQFVRIMNYLDEHFVIMRYRVPCTFLFSTVHYFNLRNRKGLI